MNGSRQHRLGKVATLVVVLLLALAPSLAQAGTAASSDPGGTHTFTVNSVLDQPDVTPGDGVCATAAGTCTLRAAVQESNALRGKNTIVVPAGTYVLTMADGLSISTDLTIKGAGANSTIIDANIPYNARVFDVIGPIVVAISGVTMQKGFVWFGSLPLGGVGLRNAEGTVTLKDVIVGGNSTGDYGFGGGLYNGGTMDLTNVVVSANFASSGGGGIYNSGTLTMRGGMLSGNRSLPPSGDGGGLRNDGNATLKDVAITTNFAGQGGGIYNNSTGTLHLIHDTFMNNQSLFICPNLYNDGGTVKLTGTDVTICP